MTRLLSRDDVGAVLTLPDCIAAVEQVFGDYAMGSVPKSESLGIQAERGTFHVRPHVRTYLRRRSTATFRRIPPHTISPPSKESSS
jgi:hypothetical protein